MTKGKGLRAPIAVLVSAILCTTMPLAQTVTESASGGTYSATGASEHAILVENATVTLDSITVTKSGDSNGEDADFYGTNAGILVQNNGTLTITGNSTITTQGGHANAVFAYGSGSTIKISDATIKTSSNNSGGIMVTGGGALYANDLSIQTQGNSSAAIRSDRGGGTMVIDGGTYETSGVGSPSIYSTADVTVSNATLNATASEGVVIEGKNSVTLNNTKVYDNNTTLNGQSTTYKNIFLYQSMSGDADQGTATFTANNCDITTVKGDTFYVTNTSASIALTGNTFTNTSGDFLRVEAGPWGNSGSNGGTVTLTAADQAINGQILVDSISSLKMTLSGTSAFNGAINPSGQEGTVNLVLSDNATLTLTDDTYVTSFSGSSTQVDTNGHSLYVNGQLFGGSGTVTPTPTLSGTVTPTPVVTATPTPETTVAPSGTPGPMPSGTPGPMPSGTPGPMPTGGPGPMPSGTPGPMPSGTPGPMPTGGPGPMPSGTPGPMPSGTPGPMPSGTPGPMPSGAPGPMPSATPTAKPTATPTAKPTATVTPTPSQTQYPETGSILTDEKGNTYMVTKAGKKNGTVAFYHPENKTVTSVTIPAKVTIDNITYKVTSIYKKAFYGCTALKKVSIGKYVSIIGAKAFYGCSTLSKLVIKSSSLTTKTVKASAFVGTPNKIKVKVPKSYLESYKSFLVKKGISKNATWIGF